jgi:type IV pilus assembly protein PilC
MANTYLCKELDMKGNLIEKTYRTDSREEVIDIIRSKGHTPVRIDLEDLKGQDVSDIVLFQPKVKTKDLSVFCKQLHTMLNAGMTLLSCMDVLATQSENKTLKATIKFMGIDVQKGDVLSTAMKKHRKVFPPLLINMIEAGELTGNLDNVLDKMSDHYVKEHKINTKIRGAMVYPSVLGILVVTVVIFLLTFIMPTFITMFTNSGVELPEPTRFVIAISDSIKSFWFLYIAIVMLIGYLFKVFISSIDGRRIVDKIKFKIPVLGTQVSKIATSRFTRTMATLLASGIPILQALESSANVTNNMMVIDGIAKVSEDIKKGASLSILLKKLNFFPPMMISMIGIGEESGSLEEMLDKTADYYDEELDTSIQRMIQILEPIMIVVMAVTIGFIVIAMLLPMFDMFKTI